MIQHRGVWFPADTVGEKWRYSFVHAPAIEWALTQCKRTRTAVQAGGNIGLWPKRLADVFQRVITFEPEPVTRACLAANVPASVEIHAAALGERPGVCGIKRRSVGSHIVIDGDQIPVTTVDGLGLADVDFLQLDIEGYEWFALKGAADTIARCRPIIQVELRDHGSKFGHGDRDVRALLAEYGYREISRQQGGDVVFAWGRP